MCLTLLFGGLVHRYLCIYSSAGMAKSMFAIDDHPECKIRVESWLAKMANQSQNWSDILSVVWLSNMYYYSLFF